MKYISGVRKILFTAPHAARQLRPGYTKADPKPRDLFTEDIASALATVCGGQALIATGKVIKDPNWYISTPFRQKIQKLIEDEKVEIVIDIHGAVDGGQPHEVVIRGNEFASEIVQKIMNVLAAGRFDAGVDRFKEDTQVTISEWLEQEKIPSIALELTRSIRENQKRRFVLCLCEALRGFQCFETLG